MHTGHLESRTTRRRRALLAGASAGAIALGCVFAASATALAEEAQPTKGPEIRGTVDNATLLEGPIDVVNAVDDEPEGADYGVIDVNDDNSNPTSITLANDAVIRVNDGDDYGEGIEDFISVVTGDFSINKGVNAGLVFAEDGRGGDGNSAILIVNGDLTGGGNLDIRMRDGVKDGFSLGGGDGGEDISVAVGLFSVLGNTDLDKVTVAAGSGDGEHDGGAMIATFGSLFNDQVSAAIAANPDDIFDILFEIDEDPFQLDSTFNAQSLAVKGGDGFLGEPNGGSGSYDHDGGLAIAAIFGDANITGDVKVIGGRSFDGYSGHEAYGGASILALIGPENMVTIGGKLMIGDSAFEELNEPIHQTQEINGYSAPSAVIFNGRTLDAEGGIVLGGSPFEGGNGLGGDLGFGLDGLDLGAIFATVSLGDQTINGDFSATYDGAGAIAVVDLAGLFSEGEEGGTTTFTGRIGSEDYSIGGLLIAPAATAVFEKEVNAYGIEIGAATDVTFNGQVTSSSFAFYGDEFAPLPSLTFNADAGEGPQVFVGYSGSLNGGSNLNGGGYLDLSDADIFLGANVGASDTVFKLGEGAHASFYDVGFVDEESGIVVFMPSNFTGTGEKDAIILIDGDYAESIEYYEDGKVGVQDTALVDYTVVRPDDGGDIIIIAERKAIEETVDELGITDQQANVLREIVDLASNRFDEEGNQIVDEALVNALTNVLNQADNPEAAAEAARTLITQEDGIGGAPDAAARANIEVITQVFERLGSTRDSRRSGGFSGGDPIDQAYVDAQNGSTWVSPFGGYATANGDGTRAGYDALYGGVAFGVDRIFDDFTLGILSAYTLSSVDGDGAGNAQIEAQTLQIGAYASYSGPTFYVDAFASYARSFNDLTRTVTIGPDSGQLTADYAANQFSAGLAGGVPIAIGQNTFLTPNASLTYFGYNAETYTETGAAPFNGLAQTVDPGQVDQLTGTLGLRLHSVYDTADGGTITPELRLGAVFDLLDDDAVATARFIGGANTFEVTGTDTDDIGALVGLGVTFDNADWSLGLSYDGDIRGDFQNHTGAAEFRWKF